VPDQIAINVQKMDAIVDATLVIYVVVAQNVDKQAVHVVVMEML